MKHLYIRYFDRHDGIPTNSVKLDVDITPMSVVRPVLLWMADHPNGKVDFVWLEDGVLKS